MSEAPPEKTAFKVRLAEVGRPVFQKGTARVTSPRLRDHIQEVSEVQGGYRQWSRGECKGTLGVGGAGGAGRTHPARP